MKATNSSIARSNNGVDGEQWLRLLEKMLGIEPCTLKDSDSLASIEEWDSLAVVQYMAMIDRNFGVVLAYEQIAGCCTLADLFAASGV